MKTTWKIDELHSEIQFKIKHLVISTVTGSFSRYSASAEASSENFSDAKVQFTAEVNSINTNNEQRDAHLKSADFFDASNYPTIDFVSDRIEKKSEGNYVVHGALTMRGVTKPVALEVEYGGHAIDPYGNSKSGFEVKGSISRKEFGLQWNVLTEAGGAVVGDEVKLLANVQMVKVVEAMTA